MVTTLTKPIENLISACNTHAHDDQTVSRIHVEDIVSRAAFLYEQVRNAVDYREDHLLRRNAVERILKRLLVRGVHSDKVAKPLVLELIRAHYIPNDSLPETKFGEVAFILERYIALWNSAPMEVQKDIDLFSWMIGVASREVEECLAPAPSMDKLVESMYRSIQPHLKLPAKMDDERERNTQLFIAIHRVLMMSDQPSIRYKLFLMYAPHWAVLTPEDVGTVGWNIASIAQAVERDLKHPISDALSHTIRKESAAFTILHDIIVAKPDKAEEIFTDPAALDEHVRKACQARYKKARLKLSRSAGRSIVFIFFTKILLALGAEVPYEIYLLNHLDPTPLVINILMPPLLLFVIAMTTRVPDKKNTEAILATVKDLVEDGRARTPLEVKRLPRPVLTTITLTLVYLALYGVTFGIIVRGLKFLNFNVVSGALFLLFLSIVSFFGIRIRQSVRRLVVTTRKENVVTFLFDLFTVPIIRAGRWISIKSSSINVFVFVLDFLIEAPFKSLLNVIEEFTSFIREKKEQVL
jgi:hypothetical protein